MSIPESDITEIVENLNDVWPCFRGKTVLVTGGQGFLGQYLIKLFLGLNQKHLDASLKLVVVDNLITSGYHSLDTKGYEFHKKDISRPFEYRGQIDFIMHAAGIASPSYYERFPLETIDVAIQGTRHMLDLARQKGCPFLFFSSSEIYGDPHSDYIPTPESYRGNVDSMGPRACYDESKRLGETLSSVYYRKFKTPTKVVRPFNVYGPGMNEWDYRVLPNFANCIIGNRPLKLFVSGKRTRTFCYITDAVEGFVRTLVLGRPGEAYNIGNSTPEISIEDLAGKVEKVLGKKLAKEKIAYPRGYPGDEPNRRCPNMEKAKKDLQFVSKVGLEDGLARFFRWAKINFTGKSRPPVMKPKETAGK